MYASRTTDPVEPANSDSALLRPQTTLTPRRAAAVLAQAKLKELAAIAPATVLGNTLREVAPRGPQPAAQAPLQGADPNGLEFTQDEVNRLYMYAVAYSKGKRTDAASPPPPAEQMKQDREDARQDLLELNPLLKPQDMQRFLEEPDEYIRNRVAQLRVRNVDADTNLCIHLYTRLLALIKYADADLYNPLRAQAEKVERRTVKGKLKKPTWAQSTQSEALVATGEATKLADIVPLVNVNGELQPLTTQHAINPAVRVYYQYTKPIKEQSIDVTQIRVGVGDYLEQYLQSRPTGSWYVFSIGIGNGYHTVTIAASRFSAKANGYIILDDHMGDPYRIGVYDEPEEMTTSRKTVNKKHVDYFLQQYTNWAWKNWYPAPDDRPLVTTIYVIHPKRYGQP